jgi:hypothetical protein
MISKRVLSKRYNRYIGVTLCYIGLKSEFFNSFVSLTAQRIMRIMFRRVSLFNYLAFFKDKKIIRGSQRIVEEGKNQ